MNKDLVTLKAALPWVTLAVALLLRITGKASGPATAYGEARRFTAELESDCK